ncbi:DUF6992 family protein [Hymenobacter sp.]|uniref:DUF6992 family protein n=1 Tax=Hymenobacter sp. TaxID=1898978 RepID=UPI00286C3B68|nr:hypothetical protein [Hymenobacter sp.]
MRPLLFLFFLVGLAAPRAGWAQPGPDTLRSRPPAPTALAGFAAERARLDRRGLRVLGGWAGANLLIGSIATGQTEGSARYFHQMNIGWGAVNLALAGAGLLAARRARRQPPTPDRPGNVRAQLKTENLYLFNAGLDVAYLATGVYLLEKGRNPTASGSSERWRGYGQSLLLQGGFLLLFDGFQYAAHHRHGNRALYPLLSRLRVGSGGVALVLPLSSARQAPTR